MPEFGAGTLAADLSLAPGLVEGSLEVFLDGEPVAQDLVAVDLVGQGGARVTIPLGSGPHLLYARARFGFGAAEASDFQLFVTPPALPPLLMSDPATGAVGVAPTEWIRLQFARGVASPVSESIELRCDGVRQALQIETVGLELFVDPEGDLPPSSRCVLGWRGEDGREELVFRTARPGPGAFVYYNRADRRATAPFPDDFWLDERAGERRLGIDLAEFPEPERWLIEALVAGTRELDGFSPIAHLTIELSEAPDPASLPLTPLDSLDPFASVGIFDLTPGRDTYGQRVPFRMEVRSDPAPGGASHALLLYPSVPFEPRGRYGLVVTRRALARGGRPFEPSLFFRFARHAEPTPGESGDLERVRALAGEVLDAVASVSAPRIVRDDVALAVRFTVRSTEDIPTDLMAIKQDVLAGPPPAVRIESVELEDAGQTAGGSRVAAIIRGTWQAPDWRGDDKTLARDPETGLPVRTRERPVRFVVALPDAAWTGPVPVTLYQHGNPGSAEEEVVEHARNYLAEAGFAVIGFTDTLNREVSPPGVSVEERARRQVVELFLQLVWSGSIPDYFVETNAEQLSFLRVIEVLGAIEQFAFDPSAAAPEDQKPIFGLDLARPLTYVGISEGANHGPALLPYAPEIRAAALISGGRRFSEVLIHQQPEAFLEQLSALGFGSLAPVDAWVALALFQTVFDRQDATNHAPYLYRKPLEIAGDPRRASVLLVEGIDDSFVPNHATESLARALGGVVQVEPVARAVPLLESSPAPLAANVDAWTTAGLYQFVPRGVAGLEPTPGCATGSDAAAAGDEGHYCAQLAEESRRQRVRFLETALSDLAPTIIDPLIN